MDPVHITARSVVPYPRSHGFLVLLCPQEHFNLSCHVGLVHGTRLLSLRWKRLLRDPVRAPDSLSCPEEASASKPSPGGLPVPLGCPVLSCLFSPGGLLILGGGVMSVLCRVCLAFPPLVSIFGLFPVLV